jgi:hypothetical protein
MIVGTGALLSQGGVGGGVTGGSVTATVVEGLITPDRWVTEVSEP